MKIPEIDIRIDEEIAIVLMGITDLTIESTSTGFDSFEKAIFEEIRAREDLSSLKDDEVFRSYRDLYWRYGMDPTKLRVSSEALVRRILRGENLWRINNLVDSMNLASAYHKIPIGLADMEHINGNLRVRQAEKGELFMRIGGKKKKCKGREIVIADDENIICFGFATHDSDYTKITKSTQNAIVYLCISPDITRRIRMSSTQITKRYLREWVPCKITNPQSVDS